MVFLHCIIGWIFIDIVKVFYISTVFLNTVMAVYAHESCGMCCFHLLHTSTWYSIFYVPIVSIGYKPATKDWQEKKYKKTKVAQKIIYKFDVSENYLIGLLQIWYTILEAHI